MEFSTPRYTPIPTEKCHTDGKFLFKLGKASIHAGSYKQAREESYGLVINLSNSTNWELPVEARGSARSICSRFAGAPTNVPAELVIDWPDGSVPKIRRKDWRRLLADLQEFDGTVLIHCMGGHGRTGTLLTILATLGNVVPNGSDPVLWLRSLYCAKIIESWTQIDYLKKNIMVRTNAEPRGFIHQPYCYPPQGALPLTQIPIATAAPVEMYKCTLCYLSKVDYFMKEKYADKSGICYRCALDRSREEARGYI